ncbi:MAG: hypothetical protein QOE63_702, partial [Acidimicrobiaceae bacterium]
MSDELTATLFAKHQGTVFAVADRGIELVLDEVEELGSAPDPALP